MTAVRSPLTLAGIAVVAMLALLPAASASADTVTRSIPIAAATRVLDVTPDGSKVVSASFSNVISVLDVATGAESTPVQINATVYNVRISPDGRTALVPTGDGSLWFFDMATGAVIGTVDLGTYLFDVAFSADGTTAYATTGGPDIVVVDVANRTESSRLLLPGSVTYGLALAADGSGLFTTDINMHTVFKVDLVSAAVSGVTNVGLVPTDVEVAADGTDIYVGSFATGSVGVVTLATAAYAPIILGGTGPVNSIVLSPDDSRLYVPRGFDNQVSIVDTSTNLEIAPLVTGQSANGIAFAANGATAFVGDADTPAVLVIAVDRPPLLAAAAPAATVGTAYSFAAGVGGSPAPAYSLTGTLPEGLTLNAATGTISGTPSTLGTTSFSITATNALGTVTQAYTITVGAISALPAAGPTPQPLFISAALLLLLGLAALRLRHRGAALS